MSTNSVEQNGLGGHTYNLAPLQPGSGGTPLHRPVPERTFSGKMTTSEDIQIDNVGERVSNPYSSSPNASTVSKSSSSSGLPILSGPPPMIESDDCRSCGKSFIPIFRRAHNCHFCGYQYCSDHSDTKLALMPRQGISSRQAPGSSTVGAGPRGGGYETVEVCDFCYPTLQLVSGNAAYLRTLPLKRLQQFIKAFNLNPSAVSAIEKEDFVQLIVKAKDPRTGTMPLAAESYYRRRSVPKEGVLPPAPSTTNTRPATANRPGQPSSTSNGTRISPPQNRAPPMRPPTQTAPLPGQFARPPNYNPAFAPRPGPGYQARPVHPQQRPLHAQTQAPRPAPTAAPPRPAPVQKRPPTPPHPTLSALVPLPFSYISTLSIGTLKAILFDNHVKVDFSQVLEKSELVKKVQELIKVERKRLERLAKEEEEAEAAAEGLQSHANLSEGISSSSIDTEEAEVKRTAPTGPAPSVERDGLCVVCQDEDAELAVVDCGHLSMCQDCSKLVMSTTRECPLCRTRIITDQRLIRIFRT